MNASWPLAVLEIDATSVTLRLRGPARLISPPGSFTFTPSDVLEVFPASRVTRAVGFTDAHGDEFYFWTMRVATILGALEDLGYPVTWTNRLTRVW